MALWAQVFPAPQDRLFWMNDNLIRLEWGGAALLESSARMPLRERSFGRIEPTFTHLTAFDQAFRAVRRVTRDGIRELEVIRSEDGVSWVREAVIEGTLRQDGAKVTGIHALGSGWYVLVSMSAPFFDKGVISHLALGRTPSDSDRIVFERAIDMELFRQKGVRAPGRIFVLAFYARSVRVENGLVLCAPSTGHFWSVTLTQEGGVRTRAGRIFSEVETPLFHGHPIEPVLLAEQPTREGKVWLATRSLDAVLKSRGVFDKSIKGWELPQKEVKSGMREAERRKVVEENLKAGLEDRRREESEAVAIRTHPEVLWWELDPETGKIGQIRPAGAKTILHGVKDLEGFGFRFRADSTLLMRTTVYR